MRAIIDEIEDAASHAHSIANGHDPMVVIIIAAASMRVISMDQGWDIKPNVPKLSLHRSKVPAMSNCRCHDSWRIGCYREPARVYSRARSLPGIATRALWMVQ